MDTLHDWLDEAWSRHDRDPHALARELLARASALPDDDDGAEAARLARHTMLGHLGDAALLQAFNAALPAGATLDPMKARAEWALATLEGRPAAPLPETVAWGLLGDVAQAELLQGRLDGVRSRLCGLEDQAARHPDEAARRAYAATTHNVTLALRLGAREPARDALMIELAALERRAWARAGTWLHVERADYQLAMCHAAIGNGAEAQAHAAACLAACEAHGADAAERFFAHECGVHAARAAGDAAAVAGHRTHMAALLAEIADAGMKAWCESTLASTPQ